jgi:hypothetical protein
MRQKILVGSNSKSRKTPVIHAIMIVRREICVWGSLFCLILLFNILGCTHCWVVHRRDSPSVLIVLPAEKNNFLSSSSSFAQELVHVMGA